MSRVLKRRVQAKNDLWLRITMSLLFALPGITTAQAQASLPAPVLPPNASGSLPPPVTPISPNALPPVQPGTPALGSAKPMSQSALTVPVAIGQLLSGKLTAERAWSNGVLTMDDLFYIFEQYIDTWGGLNGKRNLEVRRALAALLAQQGAERLKNPAAVPAKVRLWLADYYGSVGDARAVEWAESLLREVKEPVKGENALVIQALERLAWYYRDIHELERAAQTWLRAEQIYGEAGWWLPDALLCAARLYDTLGNDAKVKALYAKVAGYGDGWTSGLMQWDQAHSLMSQGQYAAARRVLEQPVTGRDAHEMRVVLLELQGYCAYRSGELAVARRLYQESLALYQSLPETPHHATSEGRVRLARTALQWIERWDKKPVALVCEPQDLRVLVNPGQTPDEPVTRRLSIRSLHPLTLTVSVDNAHIEATPVDKAALDYGFYFETAVTLKIAPQALQKSATATLTISSPASPASPEVQTTVPIHIEVKD